MQDILSRGHVALLLEIAVSSHLAIEKNAVFYEGNQSVMPKSYGYVYRAQRRRFVRLGRYPSFRHCMVPNSLLESSGSEYALFFLLGVDGLQLGQRKTPSTPSLRVCRVKGNN